MEGEIEIQDNWPYMPSSTITSNLQERDERASVSYDGSRKTNNCFARSFILGNSGESKSYNDDDEHWNMSVRMRTTYHMCHHRRPSSRRKGKEEVGIWIPLSLVWLNLFSILFTFVYFTWIHLPSRPNTQWTRIVMSKLPPSVRKQNMAQRQSQSTDHMLFSAGFFGLLFSAYKIGEQQNCSYHMR